jgi:hypothetical protein
MTFKAKGVVEPYFYDQVKKGESAG